MIVAPHCCCQDCDPECPHHVAAHTAVPRFVNTTLVPNPACMVCPDPPPCGELPEMVIPGARQDCENGYDEPRTHCEDGIPCGPYSQPTPPNTYAAGTGGDATVDLSKCRKIGFKSVYARKSHHGIRGFTDYVGPVASADWDGNNQKRSGPRNTPFGVHYLAAAVDAEIDYSSLFGEDALTKDARLLSDTAIGRYTGKLTGSRTETKSNDEAWEDLEDWLSDLGSYFTRQSLITIYGQIVADWVFLDDASEQVVSVTKQSGIEPTFAIVWSSGGESPLTYDILVRLTMNADGTSTLLYEAEIHTGSDPDEITIELLEINVTATTFSVVSNYDYEFGPTAIVSDHRTYSAELTSAYTAADVDADIDALLAYWPLHDDALYPFRIDARTSEGPLVTYNERDPVPTPMFFPRGAEDPENPGTFLPYVDPTTPPRTGTAWTDGETTIEYAEGAVVGAPLPAGYDAFFDFYHIEWISVVTGSGDLELPFKHGQYSPWKHATQWIDNLWAQRLPHGPFWSHRSLINPTKFGTSPCFAPINLNPEIVWKCKWAEVLIGERPAHNFARPCGADATERDPNTVDCDTNPAGDIRWPAAKCSCDTHTEKAITGATNASPIVLEVTAHGRTTGDTVKVCRVEGNEAANGEHTITVVDANHIELDGTSGSGSYTTGGVMTLDTGVNPFNDTTKKVDWLWKNFVYDFRDFFESYRCRTDPDVVSVPAPVRYHEVTNETFPAATIGTGSWWLKEQNTVQKRHAVTACAPTVIFVSNNGESTAHSHTIPFPPLSIDDDYGTLWLGRIEQFMPDPLWLPPGRDYLGLLCFADEIHDDCVTVGFGQEESGCIGPARLCLEGLICLKIREDNGTGQEDTIDTLFYPHRPYVEARATKPEGAPDLPEDAQPIGCANFVANQNADPPVANPGECAPHYELYLAYDEACSSGYYTFAMPFAIFTPWTIQLAQEGCVFGGGRFAAEYMANGVRAIDPEA